MADSKKYDGSQWEHSLRKLTTATEAVESPLYADGTAITTYNIKGNTTQSGTPTPSNPVEVNGVGVRTENLLTEIVQGGVRATDGNLSSSSNRVRTNYISVTGGTTYTVSCDTLLVAVICAYTNTVYDSTLSQLSAASQTVTIPQGANQIAISFMKTNGTDVTPSEAGQIMLNEGSTALPYEPYGYKIPISSGGVTTNIYLNDPLYKIGDTTDSVSSSGTATYNIGWIDLGTLDWEILASGNFHSTTIITDMKLIINTKKGNAICTAFSEVDAQDVANTPYSFSSCLNAQRTPFVNKTGFEGMTAAQFKAAMSGVIMYYVKAEATTETVTAPSIPTADGANSITVDTTVQPSEFTATWTGWHDAEVKEKSENLLNSSTIQNGYTIASDTGLPISSEQRIATTTAMKIPQGTTAITVTYNSNNVGFMYSAFRNGTLIERVTTKASGSVLSLNNIDEIYFSWYKSGSTITTDDVTNIMVNTGSTAKTYEPYWK